MEPPGQGWQLGRFFSAEKVCGTQGLHERSAVLLASASTAWPGGQARASEICVARELPAQKWSSGQDSHVALAVLPKVPTGQATLHSVAFAALKALQSQRVHGLVLNLSLNFPAGHGLQAELPAAKDPGGHGVLPPPPWLHSDFSPAPATKSLYWLQRFG
jgi:hypothetical protein